MALAIFVRAPGGGSSGITPGALCCRSGSPPIPAETARNYPESLAVDCVFPATGLNYFAFATARRATVLEFSTWAFVFVITLAVLPIILAAPVLWDVLR